MTTRTMTRKDWGCPEPGTTGQSSRPRLAKPVKKLLVHHTGAGTWPMGNVSHEMELKRLAPEIGGMGKFRLEYNYVVLERRNDGGPAAAAEWAGQFQGAHCLNFNPQSVGVLMCLNGVNGTYPSPDMIQAFWDLIGLLQWTGVISTDVEIAPHYRYRATACPGPTLAEPPGNRNLTSPTGQGSLGKLHDFMLSRPVVPSLPPDPAPSTPILGKTTVPLPNALAYAASIGCDMEYAKPCFETYWYLNALGHPVLAEVAASQAICETAKFWVNGTRMVTPEYNNPCGMRAACIFPDEGEVPANHERFKDWGDGCMAHMDHLALYAGATGYPMVGRSRDPRHFPYLYNTIPNVEKLGIWTGKDNPAYTVAMLTHMKGMRG